MVKTSSCPDVPQLQSFATGNLPLAELDELGTHLQSCPTCVDKLSRLPANDTLSEALEKASTLSATPDDPLLSSVIEQLINLGSSAGAFSDLTAGTVIGQYRLLAKLGQGGMGAVYKALHTRLDKVVALKLLPSVNLSAIARFQREMKAVGKIDHPHLVRALDAGDAHGMHYLVMEYVDGADLAQLSKRLGPLPVPTACALVRQAGLGLQVAHQRGMIHRDIKPANLMLARQEFGLPVVKVLDLGLAILADQPDANLSTAGQLMGTIDYMAPEQADDSHAVDARVDIYSLGATLYTLLTGQPLYCGAQYQTRMQKLRALAVEPIPSIRTQRPEIPTALAEVLNKMLAKQRDQRYATIAQAVEALTPFAADADLGRLLDEISTADKLTATPRQHATRDEGNATGREFIPRPTPYSAGHSSLVGRVALVALLALLPLGWWLATTILRVETANGTLVVEIKDKEVEARIKNSKLLLMGPDGQVRYTLMPSERNKQLPIGPYLIAVEGADGLVAETSRIEIKKGLETKILVYAQKKEPAEIGKDSRRIELLPLIDVAKDIRTAAWKRDPDGSLRTMPEPRGTYFLTAPAQVKGDYRLTWEFTHHAGLESFAVVLPIRETCAEVVLGSHNNNRSGFGSIDGRPHDENETTRRKMSFVKGKLNTVAIEVRTDGPIAKVSAVWNGDTFVNWSGPISKLSLPGGQTPSRAGTIGLRLDQVCNDTQIHRATLELLGPAAGATK